ncbi:hypothetical protein K2Y11_07690 [bacterium]|nr:hypothetical protein [bacterium]
MHYGLYRFRKEYLQAEPLQFPHARKFVLGGCLVGPPRRQEVTYCPECRKAESRWHEENPDFNDPAIVLNAVTLDRRALPDSLAKRILKQSQLETPERVASYLWIVYRINLYECVAYDAERKRYHYPFRDANSEWHGTISDVVNALNSNYGG